jgi:hypothetical protein
MTQASQTSAWPRPYWQHSSEEVLLQFYVFGKFEPELVIPAMRYDSPGLPAGVDIQRFQNLALRQWEGYPLKGALGEILQEESPATFEQARTAPDVLVVRGKISDRDTLDYLRDTLGVLAALLDIGGSSILDPQILSLFSDDEWRQRYLVKGGAPPRNHLLVLRSAEDAAGRSWIHTRGMRKFGRPDISLRNVPEREVDRAGALCERLIDLQSLGTHFVPGQPLEVDGLSEDLVAQLGGGLDDPQFNNTYVAFHWPD